MYKLLIFCIVIPLIFSGQVSFAGEIEERDNNEDGKTDLWIYYDDAHKRPAKMDIDRNYDGILDMWITYGAKGKKVIESDLNFDGTINMRSEYQYGERIKFEIDTDYDGKINQRSQYQNGKVIKLERDTDSDGELEVIFDRSELQTNQGKTIKRIEVNK